MPPKCAHVMHKDVSLSMHYHGRSHKLLSTYMSFDLDTKRHQCCGNDPQKKYVDKHTGAEKIFDHLWPNQSTLRRRADKSHITVIYNALKGACTCFVRWITTSSQTSHRGGSNPNLLGRLLASRQSPVHTQPIISPRRFWLWQHDMGITNRRVRWLATKQMDADEDMQDYIQARDQE